jgi:hypothetical protein
MRSSLLASAVVIEFQTMEAYSSFDLMKVKYNTYKQSREVRKCYSLNKTQQLDNLPTSLSFSATHWYSPASEMSAFSRNKFKPFSSSISLRFFPFSYTILRQTAMITGM